VHFVKLHVLTALISQLDFHVQCQKGSAAILAPCKHGRRGCTCVSYAATALLLIPAVAPECRVTVMLWSSCKLVQSLLGFNTVLTSNHGKGNACNFTHSQCSTPSNSSSFAAHLFNGAARPAL
jgi:hypothetical protein